MRTILVVLALGATIVLPPAGAGALQQDGVSAVTVTSVTSPGDSIVVRGDGWPAGSIVHIQLCGNNALAGTADCDTANTATAATDGGRFTMALSIGLPPKPCPCVVWVSTPQSTVNVRIPIEVLGAPQAEPSAPPVFRTSGVELLSVALEGSGPIAAWFGASPRRTLVVQVRNNDFVPHDVHLSVAVGTGDDPDGVVRVPAIDPLDPTEERMLRIDVVLDLLAVGRHSVVGELRGAGDRQSFRLETTAFPWGLVAIVALAFVVVVGGILRRHRRGTRSTASCVAGSWCRP